MGRSLGFTQWIKTEASSLPQLLCVFTDEPLFQAQASDHFRNLVRSLESCERQIIEQDRSLDCQQLLGLFSESSLFGDRTLVDLRLNQTKLNKDLAETIQTLCNWIRQGQTEHFLLVTGPKLNKTQEKSPGFAELLEAGTSIGCPQITRDSLPQWLRETAQGLNLHMDAEGLEWLAEHSEGNLLAAHQTLQKIALEHSGKVTADLIQATATESSRYSVFDLGQVLLSGQADRAIRMFRGLEAEGQSEVLVLWTLTEEIKAIGRIREAMQKGQSLNDACRANRVWGDRVKGMSQAIRRHDSASLKKLQTLCYEADKNIKGLTQGRAWTLLEMIGLTLAGQPTVQRLIES